MSRSVRLLAIPIVLVLVFLAADATAQARVEAQLTSLQEVPSLSTSGSGLFMGQFSDDDLPQLAFALTYSDLEGAIEQAHLHLGQLSVNGGVSIFLCTNLGNGPPGTPLCPASPATVTGVLSPEDVIGPSGQGIEAGEWGEVVRAIAAGAVYANVHTDLFPGGEIRGQLVPGQ